jgi:CheY-like chemotaxis protein
MVSVSATEPASIDLLEPEPALDGLRILLVDDDVDTREAVASVLAESGAEVTALGCAPDALAALRCEVPDVLVSDIAMPGMDGHRLMRRIRELAAERGGSIPAIALTAYASPADRTQALLAGYQVFLPKPFDPVELVTLIGKLAGVMPDA